MVEFNDILDNLRTNVGLDLLIHKLQSYDNPDLPRYLNRIYQFKSGVLCSTEVLFAFSIEEKPASITDLARQHELLAKLSGRQVIYVFESLSRSISSRLVDRRLPFIENKLQVFLPFLLLKLTAGDQTSHPIKKGENLDKWTTVLVIRQLLKNDLAGLNGLQLAKTFGISTITASRIIADMAASGLCQVRSVGTAKLIEFESRQSLWTKALPLFKNPITQTVDLMEKPVGLILLDSGESALAHQTNLVSPDQQTFAVQMTSRQAIELRKKSVASPSLFRLEIWDRHPRMTAGGDNRVDPISLYLTMRSNPDDRIQIALQELLASIHLQSDL